MAAADIEPILMAKPMVDPLLAALSGGRFSARRPLPRHPPLADLLRPHRIREIDDEHDVPAVALHLGREIGIGAVEVETVNAAAAGPIEADLLWLRGPRDVEDAQAPLELG